MIKSKFHVGLKSLLRQGFLVPNNFAVQFIKIVSQLCFSLLLHAGGSDLGLYDGYLFKD